PLARTHHAWSGPLMAKGYKKQQIVRQPDRRVRRSQAVTTYGPGALIDLLDQAVLVGGRDFWSYDKRRAIPHIPLPRLREAIAEQFKAAGLELSEEQPFIAPPVGEDREPSKFAGIQVLEFPQWFVCQNRECRAILRARDGLDLVSGRWWHNCSRTR